MVNRYVLITNVVFDLMKDLVLKGKKALHVSVMSTTLLWSMGAASVVPAFAAEASAFKDGDLIKSTARADVYLYMSGARSPFPNQAVFNSWDYKFTNVIKTSQDAINAVPLSGSNVTYRPCTRMIKLNTDVKTYVVSPNGSLHWVKTQEVATALFGSDWNKKIDDVADVFFTNYTVGEPVEAAKPIPGCFLRDAASAKTYYVNTDGTKSEVDAKGLSENRVNTKFVWTAPASLISSATTSTTQPTITGAKAELAM